MTCLRNSVTAKNVHYHKEYHDAYDEKNCVTWPLHALQRPLIAWHHSEASFLRVASNALARCVRKLESAAESKLICVESWFLKKSVSTVRISERSIPSGFPKSLSSNFAPITISAIHFSS